MAALGSSVPSVSLPFHAPVVPPRRCGGRPATAASALHRRCLPTGSTTSSSGVNTAFLPVRRASTRAQWLVGAIVVAVPAYRQFRAMEDKVERTAEAAIEVVEKVAEEAEKIADEVADTFQGNEMIKGAALKIKAVAEEIEEDADKAEALIEKVDEIKKEIDEIVDPILDKVAKK
ncbi:uncharacterized protein LOC112898879 isoform X2 [Panicum hallii]|uniref:uncharacterized protein LOC112898879 isoform X2 n=1 Tax=Panicum hallii TaxID=206008 RepID=UPI000DF4E108|nr:uncharacterized protein LOC112898879 isoform X2 [Panicum hallii]